MPGPPSDSVCTVGESTQSLDHSSAARMLPDRLTAAYRACVHDQLRPRDNQSCAHCHRRIVCHNAYTTDALHPAASSTANVTQTPTGHAGD